MNGGIEVLEDFLDTGYIRASAPQTNDPKKRRKMVREQTSKVGCPTEQNITANGLQIQSGHSMPKNDQKSTSKTELCLKSLNT